MSRRSLRKFVVGAVVAFGAAVVPATVAFADGPVNCVRPHVAGLEQPAIVVCDIPTPAPASVSPAAQVAGDSEPVVVAPVDPSPADVLPFTGAPNGRIALAGAGLVAAGAGCLAVRRRLSPGR